MAFRTQSPELAVERLDRTVERAALFFAGVGESAFDGHQTAREVLSHLVFWHREYVKIARAVARKSTPRLRQGAFAELNAMACRELQDRSMSQLATDLVKLQRALDRSASHLTRANVKLPFKAGGQELDLRKWILRIEAHIRSHLVRAMRPRPNE